MAIVRWDPFRDLFGIKRDLDRFLGRWDEDEEASVGLWRPSVDIFETKDNMILRAELPGMNKEDVKINVENNVLTLRGERKFDNEVKRENYHRIERAYGSFCRSFTLPANVDKGKIEATYKDGVLEVILPKVEESKPKQIEIKVN
jgi:HSP20 family protein